MQRPETPELDKQSAAMPKAEVLTEFYDWLHANGYRLARYEDQELWPASIGPEQLFADFFGIDRDKIEQERRALLAHIRQGQT